MQPTYSAGLELINIVCVEVGHAPHEYYLRTIIYNNYEFQLEFGQLCLLSGRPTRAWAVLPVPTFPQIPPTAGCQVSAPPPRWGIRRLECIGLWGRVDGRMGISLPSAFSNKRVSVSPWALAFIMTMCCPHWLEGQLVVEQGEGHRS